MWSKGNEDIQRLEQSDAKERGKPYLESPIAQAIHNLLLAQHIRTSFLWRGKIRINEGEIHCTAFPLLGQRKLSSEQPLKLSDKEDEHPK